MEKNFQKDKFKLFGDHIEDEILIEIQPKYPTMIVDRKDGVKNKKWDLLDEKFEKIVRSISIEVKADYVSADTGNIIVEVDGYDGDSGLRTTQSDWWVFVTGFRKIWIRTLELYRFLEKCHDAHKGIEPIVGNGDSYTKHGYKVREDKLLLYIYSLGNDDKAYIEIIPENSSMYWLTCLPLNLDLLKYIEGARKMAKKFGYNTDGYDKEISSI